MTITFVTAEIVENEEFRQDMKTKTYKCACGESYAFYSEENEENLLVVCDSCYEENPRQQF